MLCPVNTWMGDCFGISPASLFFGVHSRALIRAGCVNFPVHCPYWPRQGTDLHSPTLIRCFTKWDRVYRQNLTPPYILVLWPWRWRQHVYLKLQQLCPDLHGCNNPRIELTSIINKLESPKSVIVCSLLTELLHVCHLASFRCYNIVSCLQAPSVRWPC
jgi:hypothetical protein